MHKIKQQQGIPQFRRTSFSTSAETFFHMILFSRSEKENKNENEFENENESNSFSLSLSLSFCFVGAHGFEPRTLPT